MLWLPARVRADAGAVFQSTEERMAQKRLVSGDQPIPFIGRNLGQVIQTL
jgi:hypothetical protein